MTTGMVAAGPSAAGATRAGATWAGTARAAAIPAALTPGGAQAVFRATLDALARPGTVKRLPSAADEPLAGHVPAALLPLLALADLSTPACVLDGAAKADEASVTSEAGEASVTGQAGEASVTCQAGEAGEDGEDGEDGEAGGAAGRTAWDAIVRVATNAPRAALGDARLVAALRPLTAGELASLRTGTAAAPEGGALACLAVAGIAIVEDDAGAAGAAEEDAGAAGAGEEPGGSARESGPAGGAGESGDGRENGPVTREGRRLWLRLSGPGVPGTRAIIVTGLPAGFAAARSGLVAGFPAGADLLLIAPDGAMTGLPRTTEVREEAV